MSGRRLPGATCRLPPGGGLGRAAARRLVPCPEGIGVSEACLSPIQQARRDSTHGYDVTVAPRLTARWCPAGEWPLGTEWCDTRADLPAPAPAV